MKSIFDEDFSSKSNINISSEDIEKLEKNHSKEKTEYETILEKYKDLSQDELQNELFSKASELKKSGNLTQAQLDNLSSTLTPFLNQQQQQLLKNLVNSLSNE